MAVVPTIEIYFDRGRLLDSLTNPSFIDNWTSPRNTLFPCNKILNILEQQRFVYSVFHLVYRLLEFFEMVPYRVTLFDDTGLSRLLLLLEFVLLSVLSSVLVESRGPSRKYVTMLPLPLTWMLPRQVTGYPFAIRMSRTSWVTWIPSKTPVDSILEATFTALPQMSYCGFLAPITPATTYMKTSSSNVLEFLVFGKCRSIVNSNGIDSTILQWCLALMFEIWKRQLVTREVTIDNFTILQLCLVLMFEIWKHQLVTREVSIDNFTILQ